MGSNSPVLLIILALLLGATDFASAHSEGASFEEKIGEYTVDIGYEPAVLRAGDRVVFDFDLQSPGDKPAEFTDLWVRIEKEKTTILAAPIARSSGGPTTLLFQLPEKSGEIAISVRYQDGEKVLAESDFALNIGPKTEAGQLPKGLLLALPWILAALLGIYAFSNRFFR